MAKTYGAASSPQLSLPFGAALGQRLRDEALDSFEAQRAEWVRAARQVARLVCARKGTVTTDDLQELIRAPVGAHPSLWGSVLRAPYFRRVGRVQSRRPEAHARWIHEWELAS